ncbi:bone morphogenetic protein 1 homolog [Orbicella faveolata]|uniref:bone morphogenetic protein 1 homolog n=1 Tax=Orbicella faveolata TaxID=48498 RepID=UPI0009E62BE6|nr:bone morphogenetic protein 1 homolog [Orbicella faveolata]
MLRGPGEKTLTIYQKVDNHRETAVWVSKRKTGTNWIFGQVPLSSISKFQVSIKGEAEKTNDSIALTGLYIDEKYCKHEPMRAKQACSKNLLNMSGYFSSPSFPGNYLDDMSCTWHITVPSGHTIHLEFQEFRLKDHPRCKDCFVQIFDGQDLKSPALGRFCGYMYPPLLVSSSNHFTIDLSCLGDVHKARFKAFYHSVSALDYTDSSCLRQQGTQ